MLKQFLRKFYYWISPENRLLVRKMVFFPADVFDSVFNKADGELKPGRGDIYVGSGDFLAHGKGQVGFLLKYTNLQPESHVLDVGSGIGRTAVPLAAFLKDEGTYEGFDVVEKGVQWCKDNISKKHPNFSFTYVPVSNDLYNSLDRSANAFQFPYADDAFDLVFLFSVFSHMQVDEIENYLRQISRVLKKNGKCFFTCFTYNEQSEAAVASQEGFNFPHKKMNYRLMDSAVKNANIAIEYSYLRGIIERSGLSVASYVPGFWMAGQEKTTENDFQDILVVEPAVP